MINITPPLPIIGIYKITSPSGKIYIGQSVNWERRHQEYQRLQCKNQRKLYNSLLKYGVEQHIFELIEECPLEQLNEREIYWGEYYEVLGKNGLGLKLGNAGGKRSELDALRHHPVRQVLGARPLQGADVAHPGRILPAPVLRDLLQRPCLCWPRLIQLLQWSQVTQL